MSIDLDPSLPDLRADKARMEQVVCNLLSNASKYGRPGGRVDLRTTRDGDRARIVVKDDGRGISAEEHPTRTTSSR